ncbi:MAG: YicC family protein [Clostridia bacterium]|nr:YicC family protein [Clostridia bacterium]
MIKSMTGYGRCEDILSERKITVEIKSVNNRFSDYNIKIPRHMLFLEDKIRKCVSEHITRGKVDIYVNIESYADDSEVYLNEPVAKQYIEAAKKLRDTFALADDITTMSICRFGDVFRMERAEVNEEELWSDVHCVLSRALENFIAMRSREGERIYQDLKARVDFMSDLARQVDERSPEVVAEYKERLYQKIKETLENREIDEARVLTEVALFADKVAINEETVRLASHFEEYYQILDSDEPAGRKLDFLIQEINREVNTIGSKANDLFITKTVVTLKGEIEKMREQIQNIE